MADEAICRKSKLLYHFSANLFNCVIMQLYHIGLNITDKKEIKDFYQDIFSFKPERDFTLSAAISKRFFGLEKETEVFLMKNGNLTLELFLNGKTTRNGYNHLCIAVKDREKTALLCRAAGYPVQRLARENGDLIFVQDKAGNLFELKSEVL